MSITYEHVFNEGFWTSVESMKLLPRDLWSDVLSRIITQRITEALRGYDYTEETKGQIDAMMARLTDVELPMRGIFLQGATTQVNLGSGRLQ